MSDEPALLAAIRAHPDEDTPRLAYADWLDEHGRPERAEFIRLQCLPQPDEAQEERIYELEEANRGRWLAQLGVPQFAEARWEFRRGFPELLQADAQLFLDRFDAFARAPWLRFLALVGITGRGVRDLCGRVWPPQWRELHLVNGAVALDRDDAPALRALADCPHLQPWHRLRLTGFAIPDEDASPELRALRFQLGDWLGSNLVID